MSRLTDRVSELHLRRKRIEERRLEAMSRADLTSWSRLLDKSYWLLRKQAEAERKARMRGEWDQFKGFN